MSDGALLIDKPKDWTSHDVVAKVRRHFRLDKVGHCGTLDPMATGLLLIVVGKATKVSQQLMGSDKKYQGDITLGVVTDSYDAQGQVVSENLVPPLTESEIRDVFATFKGDQYQVPPMVSAIKINGQPLYKMARKGQEVEREPRFIHIHQFDLTAWELPRLTFELTCSKGTYARSIAFDVGTKLGCGAHLSRLVRTQSGKFKLENATSLETLLSLTAEDMRKRLIPLHELTRPE